MKTFLKIAEQYIEFAEKENWRTFRHRFRTVLLVMILFIDNLFIHNISSSNVVYLSIMHYWRNGGLQCVE